MGAAPIFLFWECIHPTLSLIVIFSDRTGVRKKPEKITRYDTIYGEILEEELWEQKSMRTAAGSTA